MFRGFTSGRAAPGRAQYAAPGGRAAEPSNAPRAKTVYPGVRGAPTRPIDPESKRVTMPRHTMRTILALFLTLGAAAGAAVTIGDEPNTVDATLVREQVFPKLCRVTVQNQLGLPLGYATGFLMGKGKFVITDLATLAQPGVVRAEILFEDGSRSYSEQFGMAMPAIGVAVINLEGDPRVGLKLAAALPDLPESLDDPSVPVASAGWEYGEALQMRRGKLEPGQTAGELAEALGGEAPDPTLRFLTVRGAVVGGASGSPVVDPAGEVVGVHLDIRGMERRPVLLPAPVLRDALLAAKPTLKPLAEVPKPVWPVEVQRMLGEPIHPSILARAVRAVGLRIGCGTCGGDGKVKEKYIHHYRYVGKIRTPVYAWRDKECPTCQGEGVVFKPAHYGLYQTVAEQGTRVRFTPDLEAEARKTITENARGLLSDLAGYGRCFREAFTTEAANSLRTLETNLPQGVFVFATVRRKVDGPDGVYAMLDPDRASVILATRLSAGGSGDGFAGSSTWQTGQRVVVAGRAETKFFLDGESVVYVRPLTWSRGPGPARPSTPDRGPGGRRKQPGEPF